MVMLRFCFCLLAWALVTTSAFAKTETLAERGKRMCEEAGVPLEDCVILPPDLRDPGPDSAIAEAAPETLPIKDLGPGPAAFGTGKYGWCEDCTSLLAAAPVTPWSAYGGRQFQPLRDEDNRQFASNETNSPSGSPGGGDDGDGGDPDDGTDNGGNEDSGDAGDGGGGEICE